MMQSLAALGLRDPVILEEFVCAVLAHMGWRDAHAGETAGFLTIAHTKEFCRSN